LRSVTPDSNVYVSALLWDGKAERLLEMGMKGKIRLFISDAILEETLGVLEEKFDLSPKKLERSKEYIQRCTVRCVPKVKLDVVKDDDAFGCDGRIRCQTPCEYYRSTRRDYRATFFLNNS
jgi:predicted nucleic acid-binding protein